MSEPTERTVLLGQGKAWLVIGQTGAERMRQVQTASGAVVTYASRCDNFELKVRGSSTSVQFAVNCINAYLNRGSAAGGQADKFDEDSWKVTRDVAPLQLPAQPSFNRPTFAGGYTRTLRSRNFGTTGLADDKWSDPAERRRRNELHFIKTEDGIVPTLVAIDQTEAELTSAQKANLGEARVNFLQMRLTDLTAALHKYLVEEDLAGSMPCRRRILLLRHVPTKWPHRRIKELFDGKVMDLVYDRRGDMDLTINGKVYVVFSCEEELAKPNRCAAARITCEAPLHAYHHKSCLRRRIQVLDCFLRGVLLSGQGWRHSKFRAERDSLRQDSGHEDVSSGPTGSASVAESDPRESPLHEPNADDGDSDEFEHIGLAATNADVVRVEDNDWQAVDVAPPTQKVEINGSGGSWHVDDALRHPFDPESLKGYSEHEEMRVLEHEFYRRLISLSRMCFGWRRRVQEDLIDVYKMPEIAQNVARGICPPAQAVDPFNPPWANVAAFDERYRGKIWMIDNVTQMRRLTAHLDSLRGGDWLAIDTESCTVKKTMETFQLATQKDAFIVDVGRFAHQPPSVTLEMLRLLNSVFACNASKFGINFKADMRDIEKFVRNLGRAAGATRAQMDEVAEAKRMCLDSARTGRIHDLRRVIYVFCGQGRDVPRYVTDRPRMSTWIYWLLDGQRQYKGLTTSMWSNRPFTDCEKFYMLGDVVHLVEIAMRISEDDRAKFQQILDGPQLVYDIASTKVNQHIQGSGNNRRRRRQPEAEPMLTLDDLERLEPWDGLP